VSCPACGSDNRPGAKFCSECGAALATACPSCGSPVEANAKFCPECGARLTPATPAAAGEPAAFAAAPAAAPTGVAERRLVTVLFADLVGFTTLAEGRDAEQVRELLSRYFEVASEIVARYGGTVEKFIGDAVMAVWGTPVAHEDDAERAVRAGLDLLDAVHALGREVGLGLDARAGALTGEAAVTLGARNQGMVAGDLVNTASRLQSVAPPGTVLVGEGTQRAAAGAIAFEPAGEQLLKGKTAPVAAWRALRVVAMVGGANRAEALEPPFVGRETEFRLLRELFHATGRERRARLLSLTGQAGIGKSRLAWEFHKYIDGIAETVYWHQGRCPSYGEGVTFWALGEMIRKRAGLAETDDETTTRGAVATALEEYVHDPEERRFIEPCLLALLGVGEAPAGGRERLFAGWRLFFERISDDATVALVFEDLQWADDGMLDFIEHLLEWSRSYPILILTLARPELLERRPTWGGGRASSSLALDPLGDDEMRALLAGLVPGLPESAVRTVLARASGIPLYAVETVRMLVSDGRLEPADDGTYRPTGDLGALEVPGSLQALIAARLDALDPGDRSLLQDASVLGQTFSFPALASVSGSAVETLEPRLRGLVHRELLDLDTDPRSPERGQYGFVQALIREVAYGMLARRDRLTRHLAAARFFESMGDDELAGALATHYAAAYEASPEGPGSAALAVQARISLKAAADRAAELGAPAQALGYLERAIALADGPDADALLEQAGSIAANTGRQADAQRYLLQAVEGHRSRNDRHRTAVAIAALARAEIAAGRIDAAVSMLDTAVAEYGDLLDEEAGAALCSALAWAQMRRQDDAKAIAWADRALVAAERLRLTETIVDALTTKGAAYTTAGRPVEAIVILEGCTRLAEDRGLIAQAFRARANLAITRMDDDPHGAVNEARTGIASARRLGYLTQLVFFAINGAEAALRVGEWSWAVEQLDGLLAILDDPGDRARIESSREVFGGLRGEPTAIDLEELARRVPDEDAHSLVADPQIWRALAEGDFRRVVDEALELARLDPLNAPAALDRAGRASAWLGDAVTLRRVMADLARLDREGRWFQALHPTLAANLIALERGPVEAASSFQSAAALWRELGSGFDLAMCQLDAVRALGAASPEGRAAADEAREILGNLGARPFLDRLAALEAGEDGPSRPGTGDAVEPIATTSHEAEATRSSVAG
jgi:class 3 adenylate cyclase/tetratricopeptide (TPR) repeat protein